MKTPAVPTIYRIKVALGESAPAIWRRIDVLETMTLAQFHEVLQIVMGWENYHLHEFIAHGKHYGNPEVEEDPKRKFYDEQVVKLKEVVTGNPGLAFATFTIRGLLVPRSAGRRHSAGRSFNRLPALRGRGKKVFS